MSKKEKLILLGVAVLCLLLRVAFALSVPADDYFYADGFDYSRVAQAIVAGKGFYPEGMEPMIVYRAPGHPHFLAFLYNIFGVENFTPIRMLQCLMALCSGLFLFGMGYRYKGFLAGIIAFGIYTIHPFFIFHVATISPESLMLFLVMALYYNVFRLFQTQSLKYAAISGVLIGLTALVKGTVLLTTPAAAFTLLFFCKAEWKKTLPAVVLMAGLSFLTISPLSLWVYNRWGEHTLLLDGSGLNFWIANSETSSKLYRAQTAEEFQTLQKNLWWEVIPAHEKNIGNVGPKARDKYFAALARERFKADPKEAFWLMGQRFVVFWRPWVHHLVYSPKEMLIAGLSTIPIFIFGFWGLVRRFKERQPDAMFMVMAMIPLTLIIGMICNTEIRWRIPLLDSLLILQSGMMLSILLENWWSKRNA